MPSINFYLFLSIGLFIFVRNINNILVVILVKYYDSVYNMVHFYGVFYRRQYYMSEIPFVILYVLVSLVFFLFIPKAVRD